MASFLKNVYVIEFYDKELYLYYVIVDTRRISSYNNTLFFDTLQELTAAITNKLNTHTFPLSLPNFREFLKKLYKVNSIKAVEWLINHGYVKLETLS